MKKKNVLFFVVLVLSLALVVVGCDSDSSGDDLITVRQTNGRLTINGLEDNIGEYVIAAGSDVLTAAANISSNGNMTGGQISSSGSVTLNVWAIISFNETTGETTIGNYNGNDTDEFLAFITNKPTITREEIGAIFNAPNPESLPSFFVAAGTIDVTFSGGIGTGTFIQTYP